MRLTRSAGSTAVGPAETFTGTVFVDGIRTPDDQSTVGGAHVRFARATRTAWHPHPKGQTRDVTNGIGYAGRRAGDVPEIRPGNVVYVSYTG